MPDEQTGRFILSSDPDRKSFKQSLIAIAFEGIYLKTLLGLIGRAKLGEPVYEKIERKTYEVKLRRLGIDDQGVLASCTRFRQARNDLIHEKPVDFKHRNP